MSWRSQSRRKRKGLRAGASAIELFQSFQVKLRASASARRCTIEPKACASIRPLNISRSSSQSSKSRDVLISTLSTTCNPSSVNSNHNMEANCRLRFDVEPIFLNHLLSAPLRQATRKLATGLSRFESCRQTIATIQNRLNRQCSRVHLPQLFSSYFVFCQASRSLVLAYLAALRFPIWSVSLML